MPDFILYIIEISISLFLFYSIYWLFLKSETYFKTNRYYITFTMLISMVIPLLNIPLSRNTSEVVYYNLISNVVVTADGIEHVVRQHLSSSQLIFYIYLAGVLIFLLRFLYQIFEISFVIFRSEVKRYGKLNYVLTTKNYSPFSFFNYIFIQKKLESDELKKILLHESIHARQLHSIDMVLMELLAIIQWFNPFVWLYKNSLQEVHEYLADQGVIRLGFDPKEYQQLIFNQVFGLKGIRLANSLNYSLTKRRFIMMTKIKSPKSALLKVLILFPVLTLTVLSFSCSDKNTDKYEALKIADSNDSPMESKKEIKQDNEEIYTEVEEMPAFPGGTKALINFITQNVKYPEMAKDMGVVGKVFISFVVTKDGPVDKVEIKRGIAQDFNKEENENGDSEYDAAVAIELEALRVVKMIPDWTPGKRDGKNVNVQFTVPITFNLN